MITAIQQDRLAARLAVKVNCTELLLRPTTIDNGKILGTTIGGIARRLGIGADDKAALCASSLACSNQRRRSHCPHGPRSPTAAWRVIPTIAP